MASRGGKVEGRGQRAEGRRKKVEGRGQRAEGRYVSADRSELTGLQLWRDEIGSQTVG
jgi:hypothetical protein